MSEKIASSTISSVLILSPRLVPDLMDIKQRGAAGAQSSARQGLDHAATCQRIRDQQVTAAIARGEAN
jgi:hypothetical protein